MQMQTETETINECEKWFGCVKEHRFYMNKGVAKKDNVNEQNNQKESKGQ